MIRLRLLLIPFSLLYWLVIAVRNWFFDKGLIQIKKVDVPVISIGNISAGGVGKTPVVEMFIGRLKEKYRLGVVSRGYRRKTTGTMVANDGYGKTATAEKVGDEPGQISSKFPNLIVVVDEKRVRGARKAIETGAEMILLDDGFQHRFLHRDLDAVIITVDEILNGDFLLPAGNRREPINSLKRADAIFISRCSDVSEFKKAFSKVESFDKPVIGLQTELRSFKPAITDKPMAFSEIAGKKVVIFSGIGNPKSFKDLLNRSGLDIVKNFVFPDHHWYSNDDIDSISSARKESGAEYIITTEKDVARMRDNYREFLIGEKVIAVEIHMKVIAGQEQLNGILNNFIN